ncbi:MAG TPA: sialate O-acetylesterase [Gammaproteobacteria bacterium]
MKTIRLFLCMLLVSVSTVSQAKLELPLLFSDGMVLQRDLPVHVWGRAEPGASVGAAFDGKTARTKAGKDGRWELTLPAHKAGAGPYSLDIVSGEDKVSIHNVAVGDVWIASGQSNMEWTLADAQNASEAIKGANDPQLRHFKVPKSWAAKPAERLAGGSWESATPDTAGGFTAVGYFFARELRAETGIPIGLLHTSWGGSRIEAWMSGKALGMNKRTLDARLHEVFQEQEKILDAVREKLKRWPVSAGGIVDGKAVWANPRLDDSDWISIPVPMLWEQTGFEGMDGVAWYRATFELNAREAAKGVTLGLGKIDDSDRAWVNGYEVGGMEQSWNATRTYSVPPHALKHGRNVVSIRVEDTGGGGGIHGDPGLVFVQAPGREPRKLSDWKFKADEVRVSFDDRQNKIETLLYNKMIYPLQPYPIKGVIWYQGESNADDADSALNYRKQFADMIRSWRRDWEQGDFPFLWVQLANFISGGDTADSSPWAILRESQLAALSLPNTAQAVTIDIGDPADIHPRNKHDVGHRLALAALHKVYGKQDIVYSGPVLRETHIDKNKVILSFDHIGSGLAVRGGGRLQGFTVAGADNRFLPAEAIIKGNQVVVSRPGIDKPVAVRYAWSDNPQEANLINKERLPASPFRTVKK